MQKLKEFFKAVHASKDFAALFTGVSATLPDGRNVFLKVEASDRYQRPSYYKWNEHSVVTKVVDQNSGISGMGYGEDETYLVALQKSISEAVERTLFFLQAKTDAELLSTNGWAAHLSESQAKNSAKNELLERDAVLLHWLSETPLTSISLNSMPRRFRNWASQQLSKAPRYNKVSFFISTLGNIKVASAMIHDENRFGFISHATGNSVITALSRATEEATRIADFATQGALKRSDAGVRSPEDHALYYSEEAPFPNWIFNGKVLSAQEALKLWNANTDDSQIHFDFDCYQFHHLSIVHCKSRHVQELYFGETSKALEAGIINLERVYKFTGAERVSTLPHFVP